MAIRMIAIVFLALLLASPALAAQVIVIDHPDPLGDHTAAIQSALDRCSFDGADCEIRFLEGTYRFATVSSENFHGAIKGAGMDASVLLPLPGQMAPDADYCADRDERLPVNNETLWPMMMQFAGGDFTIADLTLSVPYPAFADDQGWCGGFTGLAAILMITGADTRSRIERVAFQGSFPSEPVWAGLLMEGGALVGKQLGGSHAIVGSSFREFFWAFNIVGASGGEYVIGGRPQDGNLIDTSMGFEISDMSDSRVMISYNDLRVGGQGMWLGNVLFADMPSSPSRFTVASNHILLTSEDNGWWWPNAAIQVVDGMATGGPPTRVIARVSSNTIELDPVDQQGADVTTGILVAFAHGAMIANNRISGRGRTAIEVPEVASEATAGFEATGITEHCAILANNVQGFDASVARIHLGPTSTECVALAGKGDVLNEGLHNRVVVVKSRAARSRGR